MPVLYLCAGAGQMNGKTGGGAVHSAVQNGCFSPNGRQNQRRCRSFCRSKRLF